MKRTPLRRKGNSETTKLKDRIQELVRDIVIIRDGGCILRDDGSLGIPRALGIPACNGYRKDGEPILQADHLLTRANSATFADSRLIVCVCKGHHGWKKWNEQRYNEIVRTLIGYERCKLWDACHAARYKPVRTSASDWRIELAALKQELCHLRTAAA